MIVHGGVEDGMVATFYFSSGMDASIVPVQNGTMEEPVIVNVSTHQLECEFNEGDFVRHISVVGDEPERVGTVIKIVDLTLVSEEKERCNGDLLTERGAIGNNIMSQTSKYHMKIC